MLNKTCLVVHYMLTHFCHTSRHLDLSFCRIRDLPSCLFDDLPNLTVCGLGGFLDRFILLVNSGLFDTGWLMLSNFQEVNLANNQLSRIPPADAAVALTSLSLENNDLTDLVSLPIPRDTLAEWARPAAKLEGSCCGWKSAKVGMEPTRQLLDECALFLVNHRLLL